MPRLIASSLNLLRSAISPFIITFNELFPSIVSEEVSEAEADGFHIDAPSDYCHRCGATVGPGEATPRGCSHCVSESIAWDRIVRLTAYKEPLSAWIIAMKFHKEWCWAKWFGERLAESVRPIENPERTLVCHAPTTWYRRWRRGYSQAELIAASFARSLKLSHGHIIRRRGSQSPQTSIVQSQRRENVRNAFRIENVDLAGWHLWLIDDVKTSGATLGVCTKLLKSAGAASVNIAVAAVADPKHADFKLK